MNNALMNTYNRFPLTLVKGEGSYVWDDAGNKYLDFTSGIATCNLGHVNLYVKEKVEQQLNTLWHCSNLYHIPPQEKLASQLVNNSCFDQVFFGNSGAEANEGAIKLARKYTKTVKNSSAYEIVTFKQSFHGRTLATLTATGQSKVQIGFEPLPEGFRYLPYNDFDSLKDLFKEQTCAVMLELIQAEGGVVVADKEWVKEVVRICKKNDVLLIIDEVQTGMGRTGTLFAYQQFEIEPDIITLAKGLGSGFPIGAVLAKKEVAKAFTPGSHGSTFGGNPLATTAGLATIEYITEKNICQNVSELGNYFKDKLHELLPLNPILKEVRGKGLLLGIALEGEAIDVVNAARQKGVLILVAGANVVRILPPLTTNKDEIDHCLSVLKEIVTSSEYMVSC